MSREMKKITLGEHILGFFAVIALALLATSVLSLIGIVVRFGLTSV